MSITSQNARLLLSVSGVFDAPFALQDFSADDIFDTNDVPPTEAVMGVDGNLTGGVINVPVVWSVSLMADSVSNVFFDNWAAAQKLAGDVFTAQGTVLLTSIGREFTMVKGLLTGYKPMPDARRLLQARRYAITWQQVQPANIQF